MSVTTTESLVRDSLGMTGCLRLGDLISPWKHRESNNCTDGLRCPFLADGRVIY